MLDDLHVQTRQTVIENRVTNIEYREAIYQM